MRRLLLVALALAAAAVALWLLAGPPRDYFLREECGRYHEERRERFSLLRFQRARADAATGAEIDRQTDAMLKETRTFTIRGWEVVLVPAGAVGPSAGYFLRLRYDPSAPKDPAPTRGTMLVWVRPRSWLARLFPDG
ncbi:MAG TPA: hypothetical protein VFY93_10495 [Planctomycetota bacterium]|nr:hypothetical protein [Planctomycetota bacterium]